MAKDLDFELIKKTAQDYGKDMTAFLRAMISHPSESCEEGEVVACIKAEMEKLGFDEVKVDGLGNVMGFMGDGDKIIALVGTDMKERGRLDGNTVVVTVMSNLGFIKFMESQGIYTEKTAVGDRYVLENMRENGYAIGGEQSGHVILLHHATTGDGELTAGKLLKLLAESGKKMSELNGIYAQYPQVLVNVVANAAQKAAYKGDKVLADFIENEQQKLMDMGRVLVRVSGTEPKIRVMVEGQDLEAIDLCAKRIVDKINERIIEG